MSDSLSAFPRQETAPDTPTPTAAAEVSPLERMQSKIRAAEQEFAGTLKTEFEAIYAQVNDLDDQMSESFPHLENEYLRKVLGKVLKLLDEVITTLGPGADD